MWELVGGLVKAGHVSTLALCPSLLDALLASQRLDLVEKLLRHLRDVPRAALEAVLLAALPPDGATLLRTHRVGTRARWRWSPATLVHRNATCIVLSGTWVCLRCDARGAREPGAAGRRRQGRGAHGAAHGGGDNPGNPGASAHGTHRRRRRAVGARPLLALCLPLCLSHRCPHCVFHCLSQRLAPPPPPVSRTVSLISLRLAQPLLVCLPHHLAHCVPQRRFGLTESLMRVAFRFANRTVQPWSPPLPELGVWDMRARASAAQR
jgi:hypothetical protein